MKDIESPVCTQKMLLSSYHDKLPVKESIPRSLVHSNQPCDYSLGSLIPMVLMPFPATISRSHAPSPPSAKWPNKRTGGSSAPSSKMDDYQNSDDYYEREGRGGDGLNLAGFLFGNIDERGELEDSEVLDEVGGLCFACLCALFLQETEKG